MKQKWGLKAVYPTLTHAGHCDGPGKLLQWKATDKSTCNIYLWTRNFPVRPTSFPSGTTVAPPVHTVCAASPVYIDGSVAFYVFCISWFSFQNIFVRSFFLFFLLMSQCKCPHCSTKAHLFILILGSGTILWDHAGFYLSRRNAAETKFGHCFVVIFSTSVLSIGAAQSSTHVATDQPRTLSSLAHHFLGERKQI